MKKLLSTLLLLAGGLQAEEIHRAFSPETKLILKADMEAVRAVPELNKLVNNRHAEKFRGMISNFIGVELQKTQTLWIGALEKHQAVIVLEGDYDVKQIQKACETHGFFEKVDQVDAIFTVNIPDKKKSGKINQLAVIDDHMLVFGPPEYIQSYLKAYFEDQDLMTETKLKKTDSLAYDSGLMHAVVLEHDKKCENNPLLKQLIAMEFNVAYEQDFKLSMMMKSDNKELLTPLKQMIEGLIGLGQQMTLPKVPPMMKDELLGQAKVSVNDDQININTQLSAQIIQDLLNVLVY